MRYLSAHGARRGTIDEVFPNFQIYRDVWKTAGHPGEGEVYVRDPVYVGDTVDQALSNPEESLRERPRGSIPPWSIAPTEVSMVPHIQFRRVNA
jgi:hypothetical protein